MNEGKYNFKNYVLKIPGSQSRTDKALLLFHGFPGESFNGTELEKNRDLAQILGLELGCDSFVHHYNGLGQNTHGEFSFINSIEDSIELTRLLLKDYKELILVGHSWGGLVAINCFHQFHENISQMILLSPFNKIPETFVLKPVLEALFTDFPYILKEKSINDHLIDFEHIAAYMNPRDKIKQINYQGEVLVLQAQDDNEVPIASTDELSKMFSCKINYEIVNTDHSFSINRQVMFKKCIDFLKNHD